MIKYDIKKVPRELLEEYVAKQAIILNPDWADYGLSDIEKKIREAAKVEFRTKAEVDADIAKAVRDYAEYWSNTGGEIHRFDFRNTFVDQYGRGMYLKDIFIELLSEETSD